MNVVLESQAGDPLVCIMAFGGSPEGQPFDWKTCREFRLGERVRFVSAHLDEHFKDRPNGWMVAFDAADGKRYAATQTYFVTEECWAGLKKFFARRLLREPTQKRVVPTRELVAESA